MRPLERVAVEREEWYGSSALIGKFLRRCKYGEPIIVVSGLPRSGTSMMMRMLEAGGVETLADGLRTADEDNPKGYFEDERVKSLDKMDDKSWLREARGKSIKVISFLLRDLPPQNQYKVVFMNRELAEIIASQKKMLERREEENDAVDDEKMAENFENHLRKVRYFLDHASRFETLYVDYKKVIDNPAEQAQQLVRFLDLSLDPERMAQAVDSSLYRNRAP